MKHELYNSGFYLTKVKLAVIVSVIVFFLSAILFAIFHQTKVTNDDTVLTVNDEPVTMAEYINIMSGVRTNVYSYISQKYRVSDSKDFWTTSFNGEIPEEILKQNTVNELTRIKILHILMKKYGITNDISYSAFLNELSAENERRKITVAKNQPIYGPIEFEEKTYYDYLMSERTGKLKQILLAKEIFINEDECQAYFNKNLEEKFRKPDYIKIEKISLQKANNNDEVKEEKKIKIETDSNLIMNRVRNGEKFENVVNDYKNKGIKGIEYETLVFDASTQRNYSTLFPEIFLRINNLKINQISNFITMSDSWDIIKIMERKTNIFYTFDEVKGNILRELENLRFDSIINSLVNNAKVIKYDKTI